jgi:hypothetical protein
VINGEPVLRQFEVTVLAADDQVITPQILRELSSRQVIDDIIAQAASLAALGEILDTKSDEELTEAELRTVGFAAVNAVHGRRPWRATTPEWLEKVATVYQKNRDYAPVKAVAKELNMSHRSATRWVGEARSRGYIEEEG